MGIKLLIQKYLIKDFNFHILLLLLSLRLWLVLFMLWLVLFIYILQVINKDTVCLSIGDGSLIPLIAAKLGAKKVSACNWVFLNLIKFYLFSFVLIRL